MRIALANADCFKFSNNTTRGDAVYNISLTVRRLWLYITGFSEPETEKLP